MKYEPLKLKDIEKGIDCGCDGLDFAIERIKKWFADVMEERVK